MAITKQMPPLSASEAATRRLASLERALGRVPDMEVGGGTLASPERCLPVYYLDSTADADGNLSLEAVKRVGWQYLVGAGDGAKSVEVIDDIAVGVDRGQVALDLQFALDIAKTDATQWDYEARMLTFGRVANPVLWLHPGAVGIERFFALGPTPHEVPPEKVLAEAQANALDRKSGWSAGMNLLVDESGG